MAPNNEIKPPTDHYPLFELMSQEHDLTLTDGQMWDIIECVRKLIKQEGGE